MRQLCFFVGLLLSSIACCQSGYGLEARAGGEHLEEDHYRGEPKKKKSILIQNDENDHWDDFLQFAVVSSHPTTPTFGIEYWALGLDVPYGVLVGINLGVNNIAVFHFLIGDDTIPWVEDNEIVDGRVTSGIYQDYDVIGTKDYKFSRIYLGMSYDLLKNKLHAYGNFGFEVGGYFYQLKTNPLTYGGEKEPQVSGNPKISKAVSGELGLYFKVHRFLIGAGSRFAFPYGSFQIAPKFSLGFGWD